MGENPNNPEIPVEESKEQIVLSKKEHDELVENLAKETKSKINLVEELKTEREKKNLSESANEELRKKLEDKEKVETGEPVELTPEKVAEIAEEASKKVLMNREAEDVETNKKSAFDKFKQLHKEFHNENDEGGIKWAALERKIVQFNLSNVKTESEFLLMLEDAKSLLNKGKVESKEETPNPYSSSSEGETTQREVDTTNLTPQELKIIDRSFDGDRERYLKIKASRPDYVEQLLTGRHAH